MGFTKKTWKNRIAEYINRRLITMEDGSTNLVTVARDEGTISQEGDAFNAVNMNDLEDRIEAGFADVTQSLANIGKRTILWTNPNTANANFPAQTISIDLNDADEIEIYCCVDNSRNYGIQIYRFLFVSGTIAAASKSLQGGGNYNTLYIRSFTMYKDKIVVANGATQASTGANAINNNAQVPFKIVKIKY